MPPSKTSKIQRFAEESNSSKSRRNENWEPLQICTLFEALLKEPDLTPNPIQPGHISRGSRTEAWDRVTVITNAVMPTPQTVEQIQSKVRNYALVAKRRFNEILKHCRTRIREPSYQRDIYPYMKPADEIALRYLGFETRAGIDGIHSPQFLPDNPKSEHANKKVSGLTSLRKRSAPCLVADEEYLLGVLSDSSSMDYEGIAGTSDTSEREREILSELETLWKKKKLSFDELSHRSWDQEVEAEEKSDDHGPRLIGETEVKEERTEEEWEEDRAQEALRWTEEGGDGGGMVEAERGESLLEEEMSGDPERRNEESLINEDHTPSFLTHNSQENKRKGSCGCSKIVTDFKQLMSAQQNIMKHQMDLFRQTLKDHRDISRQLRHLTNLISEVAGNQKRLSSLVEEAFSSKTGAASVTSCPSPTDSITPVMPSLPIHLSLHPSSPSAIQQDIQDPTLVTGLLQDNSSEPDPLAFPPKPGGSRLPSITSTPLTSLPVRLPHLTSSPIQPPPAIKPNDEDDDDQVLTLHPESFHDHPSEPDSSAFPPRSGGAIHTNWPLLSALASSPHLASPIHHHHHHHPAPHSSGIATSLQQHPTLPNESFFDPFSEPDSSEGGEKRAKKVYRPRVDPFEGLETETDFVARFRLDPVCIDLIAERFGKSQFATRGLSSGGGLTHRNRVALALMYLGSGSPYSILAESQNLSRSTVCRAVRSVCEYFAEDHRAYIKWPDQGKRSMTAETISHDHNLPQVCGIVDGCHVPVKAPHANETTFMNSSGYHSLNVMFVSDAKKLFTYVKANMPGSSKDAQVFSLSQLAGHMESGKLGPFVILGDSSYPLKPNLLTPLKEPTTPKEEEYNKCFRSAHSIVERAIDDLKKRFRCLDGSGGCIQSDPIMASKIILTCACLHNLAERRGLDVPDIKSEGTAAVQPPTDVEPEDDSAGQAARQDVIDHL